MKEKTYSLTLCIAIFFVFSSLTKSTSHPIKLTSSVIKYDTKTKNIGMECKVFMDDFAQAFFSADLLARMNTKLLTEDDKKRIEAYFVSKYKITINGKKLPLKFEKYQVKDNVMTISFSKNHLTLKKGDILYIENKLLFEEFEDLQSNWITLRIPPFIPNHNFACELEDYSYSHTF